MKDQKEKFFKKLHLPSHQKEYNILGIHLPEKTKYLYSEHYRTLMKETEEDANRWENMPSSWVGKINIVKMTILPKAINVRVGL